MKEKIQKYMQGRYGMDALNRFLVGASVVSALISMLVNSPIFYAVGIIGLLCCYIRMFSKNHAKRYQENSVYMKYKNWAARFLGNQKRRLQQSRLYHIYRCPSCKQKIRIPRGKGKVMVTCPKCRTEFKKKS